MKQIPLINQGLFALVDDSDYALVSNYRWYLLQDKWNQYAVTGWCGRNTAMHRLILNPLPIFMCDHINGNGLDNRRENLRICDNRLNQRNRKLAKNNTTGFTGVGPKNGKYVSQIKHHGKVIHLGTFATIEQAALARKEAEARLWS